MLRVFLGVRVSCLSFTNFHGLDSAELKRCRFFRSESWRQCTVEVAAFVVIAQI